MFNGIIGNGIIKRNRKPQKQISLFTWMLDLTANPNPNQDFYDANLSQKSLLFNLVNLTADPNLNQDFLDSDLSDESLFYFLNTLE